MEVGADPDPSPVEVSWYVTDTSNAPINGASLTIYWATSPNGPFAIMPYDYGETYILDKIANIRRNPIYTGYWNPDHPNGMAVCDLHPGPGGISGLYFYVRIDYGMYSWYWPVATSYKPGTPSWGPVAASGSPSGYAAAGPGIGNGPTTAYPTQQPPVQADLSITKSGPQYAHVGATIVYTFTVSNAGPDSATGVVVTDSKAGTATYVSGDTDGDGKLDVGETWAFTASYTVLDTDPDPLPNTATVSSSTPDPIPSNNQASWSVDIIHPEIDVRKTADKTMAHVGDTITYTINVSNPSADTIMTKVSVVDTLLGDISGDFSVSLAPLAFQTKTYTHTVASGDADPLENTVTVKYKDALNTEKTASDSESVDILHPAIDVTKNANKAKAYTGETVTYTIAVVNTGDCILYNVMVTDTWLGPIWSGTLAVGQSQTFTPTYTVKAGDPDPLVNTVSGSGKDIQGKEVTDSAAATVDLIAKICGYKFNDANDNGIWDAGETPVGGIKIELWFAGSKIAETTTGSDGKYCFNELNAGTYTIKEILPTNRINTTPISLTVTLKSGEISEDNNFGNYQAPPPPPPPPVGGVWVPINKFELLAPWISLASLITVAAVSIVYVKHRKKQQN
jgi:uncharacterized repeat protein (TIGR01451 family)